MRCLRLRLELGAGEIEVQLVTRSGEPFPLPGVLLDIRFYVDSQFRYAFSLGRTDENGMCSTTMEEIERQLAANRRFFLMDYNTPPSDCDTVVGIVAPTSGELAEREAARANWWPETPSSNHDTANEEVCGPEQKVQLEPEGRNAFSLVCSPPILRKL